MARQKTLPRDQFGVSIQALALDASPVEIDFTDSSSRVALPVTTEAGDIVRLAASDSCYIAFGDGSVTASSSSSLFPAGVEVFAVPVGATYVAAVRATANGKLSITELL